jgi:hypothetical protein
VINISPVSLKLFVTWNISQQTPGTTNNLAGALDTKKMVERKIQYLFYPSLLI